jgi:hypothetical protein
MCTFSSCVIDANSACARATGSARVSIHRCCALPAANEGEEEEEEEPTTAHSKPHMTIAIAVIVHSRWWQCKPLEAALSIFCSRKKESGVGPADRRAAHQQGRAVGGVVVECWWCVARRRCVCNSWLAMVMSKSCFWPRAADCAVSKASKAVGACASGASASGQPCLGDMTACMVPLHLHLHTNASDQRTRWSHNRNRTRRV